VARRASSSGNATRIALSSRWTARCLLLYNLDIQLFFPVPKRIASPAVHHNAWTGHFPKLLIHLIRELETAGSAKELPVKAVNTVYFTRLFVKHLVELYSSKEISSHLVMRGDEGTPAGETTDTKHLLLKKSRLPSIHDLELVIK
jgi:hypothetical protein